MPGCVRITTAKYRQRPSPPYHASDCKGKTLKGNDGKRYKSQADSRGVYKWVAIGTNKTRKAKVQGKCYEIHDNYNVPFVVCVQKGDLAVYKAEPEDETADKWKMIPGKLVHQTHYRKLHFGERKSTVLAQVSADRWLFVGPEVVQFALAPSDEPVSYSGSLGNNDYPYPYLVGKKYVYFLALGDYFYLPCEHFDLKKDLYGQYYEMSQRLPKGKKLPGLKILQKRKL